MMLSVDVAGQSPVGKMSYRIGNTTLTLESCRSGVRYPGESPVDFVPRIKDHVPSRQYTDPGIFQCQPYEKLACIYYCPHCQHYELGVKDAYPACFAVSISILLFDFNTILVKGKLTTSK